MSARVARALLSVSDKSGLVAFATGLSRLGITLLSTGGTAKALADAGLAVVEIGDYTGFPEMLDGRVKTLHPKVHGGILARRDDPGHQAALERHSIPTIDLVVVNLYPFRETVAAPGCTLAEAIENIDIGGPAMVRSAAKNWRDVGVVVDPADYAAIVAELAGNGAVLSTATRFTLARKAFSHTAAYDGAISNWLTARGADGSVAMFPDRFNLQATKVEDLRYGENPHQQAAFYRDESPAAGAIATFRQLQGKELSFNNIADGDAAWECVKSFAEPACVIVKHANPCGVAIAASPLQAYRNAFATDPTSAFGGIIAFNRPVDAANARSGRRAIPRSADRAGLHARCARGDRAEEERPRARGARRGGVSGGAARFQACAAAASWCRRRMIATCSLRSSRWSPGARRRRRSSPTSCSRGALQNSSSRTPSSIVRAAGRSASAPAR